jgi:hypothetical protein
MLKCNQKYPFADIVRLVCGKIELEKYFETRENNVIALIRSGEISCVLLNSHS